MSLAGRLLVIDFDYFFVNPAMTRDMRQVWAYDWVSNETKWHITEGWYGRAQAFLANDLPLPRCNGDYFEYERFWERFALTEEAAFRYGVACDSNMHAGRFWPRSVGLDADGWREVHLYDAHHDCGYTGEGDAAWEATDRYGCADWMRLHHAAGCKLHVHYPSWRADEHGELVDC